MAERWRHQEVAERLGVTRQRVQQLAASGRLPPPTGEDRIKRHWRPSDIRRWAKVWPMDHRLARLCPPFDRAHLGDLTGESQLHGVEHTTRYISHPSLCARCAQHLARVYLRAFVGGQGT
jgi:predicted DNA-binding transcriptional regulator AlpA